MDQVIIFDDIVVLLYAKSSLLGLLKAVLNMVCEEAVRVLVVAVSIMFDFLFCAAVCQNIFSMFDFLFCRAVC